MTTDNVILAGFAAQPQYQGKLKVVGKPFSEEQYGVGLKKGDTELCGKVNAALEKMVSDGIVAEGAGRDTSVPPASSPTPPPTRPSRTPAASQPCATVRWSGRRTDGPPRPDQDSSACRLELKVGADGLACRPCWVSTTCVAAFWMTIKLTVLSARSAR